MMSEVGLSVRSTIINMCVKFNEMRIARSLTCNVAY